MLGKVCAQTLNQFGFHSLTVDFWTWLESISEVQADFKSFPQTPSPPFFHVHGHSFLFSHSCLEILGPFGYPLLVQIATHDARNMGELIKFYGFLLSKIFPLKPMDQLEVYSLSPNCYLKLDLFAIVFVIFISNIMGLDFLPSETN